MKICALDREIHTCPYLGEGQECLSENTCSMQEKEEKKENYVRKPRWYDDYYKRNK